VERKEKRKRILAVSRPREKYNCGKISGENKEMCTNQKGEEKKNREAIERRKNHSTMKEKGIRCTSTPSATQTHEFSHLKIDEKQKHSISAH